VRQQEPLRRVSPPARLPPRIHLRCLRLPPGQRLPPRPPLPAGAERPLRRRVGTSLPGRGGGELRAGVLPHRRRLRTHRLEPVPRPGPVARPAGHPPPADPRLPELPLAQTTPP